MTKYKPRGKRRRVDLGANWRMPQMNCARLLKFPTLPDLLFAWLLRSALRLNAEKLRTRRQKVRTRPELMTER